MERAVQIRRRHKQPSYRWRRIVITAAALAIGAISISSCKDIIINEPQYVEYHKVVNEGETLWDICSKVNDDREDVRDVIRRTVKDNNIPDVGKIQPGQKLIIHVKEVK